MFSGSVRNLKPSVFDSFKLFLSYVLVSFGINNKVIIDTLTSKSKWCNKKFCVAFHIEKLNKLKVVEDVYTIKRIKKLLNDERLKTCCCENTKCLLKVVLDEYYKITKDKISSSGEKKKPVIEVVITDEKINEISSKVVELVKMEKIMSKKKHKIPFYVVESFISLSSTFLSTMIETNNTNFVELVNTHLYQCNLRKVKKDELIEIPPQINVETFKDVYYILCKEGKKNISYIIESDDEDCEVEIGFNEYDTLVNLDHIECDNLEGLNHEEVVEHVLDIHSQSKVEENNLKVVTLRKNIELEEELKINEPNLLKDKFVEKLECLIDEKINEFELRIHTFIDNLMFTLDDEVLDKKIIDNVIVELKEKFNLKVIEIKNKVFDKVNSLKVSSSMKNKVFDDLENSFKLYLNEKLSVIENEIKSLLEKNIN